MARTEITFFTAGNRSAEGGTMPVPRFSGLATEVVASGAASVATASVCRSKGGTGFVRVFAEADIWVVAGPAPVSVAPAVGQSRPGLRVRAGEVADFALEEGDKLALVNL